MVTVPAWLTTGLVFAALMVTIGFLVFLGFMIWLKVLDLAIKIVGDFTQNR